LCFTAVARPARSQGAFRFQPPVSTRAVGGSYTVRWTDDDNGIADGCRSITWYYSPRSDGSDRKRMTTRYRDDFTGYMARWKPEGAFNFDWKLRRDGERGHVLYSRGESGPLYSREATDENVVVSTLVRPRNLKNDVCIGFRLGANGTGYEVRSEGNVLRVLQEGEPLPGAMRRVFEITPRKWYWYEVGLRSRRGKEVEIRVRIYDETRRVLACIPGIEDRPRNKALLRRGILALCGAADFAELYVDPWEARWADDTQNEFRWDTSQVPDGDYYVLAELSDAKGPAEVVVSPFQVEVRNRADGFGN
jgi:hypothetical protein